MSFVRTVLGDIDPRRLGVCQAHEHIIIDESHATQENPDFLLNDVEKIAEELGRFREAGGQSMIDSMPCDCGRNVLKLAEVSQRSGVRIVAPTGIHLARYYPKGHWSLKMDAEALAELFIADIEQGIDANDYGGPVPRRTPHRAGVIKVAAGERLSDHERKCFVAAAIAHRITGAPILTHTEQGRGALEQVQLLRDAGVDPRHVVLSHVDRMTDAAYHRDVLQSGVRVEYDSAFRWKTAENPTFDLLLALLADFPDRIMLGMDAARRGYWSSFGGTPGLTYLLTEFAPKLRSATSPELVHRVFVTTPADAYQFMTRAA